MTLQNFKTDNIEFELDGEEADIKKKTIDHKIHFFQWQDRAKLLIRYNKQLSDKCDKVQEQEDKRKIQVKKDFDEINETTQRQTQAVEELTLDIR